VRRQSEIFHDAAALGEDNFDVVNEINPDTAQRWEDLKNIGVHGTKISPENLIYLESATPKKQESQIKKLDIRNYKVDEVRFRGLNMR
jgi:arginase